MGDKEKIREYAGENVDQAIGEVEVILVDPSASDGEPESLRFIYRRMMVRFGSISFPKFHFFRDS